MSTSDQRALIKVDAQQFRVRVGESIGLRRAAEIGETLHFDKVLAVFDDKGKAEFGAPFLSRVKVEGKVENLTVTRGIAFKKKRRKNYKRTRGFRKPVARVRILSISRA